MMFSPAEPRSSQAPLAMARRSHPLDRHHSNMMQIREAGACCRLDWKGCRVHGGPAGPDQVLFFIIPRLLVTEDGVGETHCNDVTAHHETSHQTVQPRKLAC